LSRWFAPGDVPLRKELAGKLLFSFVDAASGGSLPALLWLQKLLWLANAAMAYRLLRRGGLKPAPAALVAGLLALSFPALLLSSSFATAGANVFFFLCALTAAASLLDDPTPARLAWLMACGLLVLLSRLELAPVVAWAAALALARRRRWKA